MSEVKTNTFQAIPKDAIIDIQVSGSFYRQLTKLSLGLGESKTPEEFRKALDTLNTKQPESLYELTVMCVVGMIFEIETKAREQNKIEMVEIDLDTGELVPPKGPPTES